MSDILLKNIHTMGLDLGERKKMKNAHIHIQDNLIMEISPYPLEVEAEHILDCSGMVVMPGMVNTHHHMYQTMQRAVPLVQNSKLFHWLTNLYEIWTEVDAEIVHTSAKIAMAELMLTGCTTASDQFYVFPRNEKGLLEAEIKAADQMGIRFHPCRGSMSRGKSNGGLPPDHVVQSEKDILRDSEVAIRKFHDPDPLSMRRIVISPCSPFSVTSELMRSSAELARKYGVQLHTHLAETKDEEDFCVDMHCLRPFDYMKEVDWVGEDVWFAHSIYMNDKEIREMAKTGTGMSHCPTSNMRLGSGIAPIRKMLDEGVKVSLGVDGSASNDSSNMINEARMAMMLQRVKYGEDAFTPYEALACATTGGARVLERDDVGIIEEGRGADIIGFRLDQLPFAGGLHDPLASLVLCGPMNVDLNIINGEPQIMDGRFLNLDLRDTIDKQNLLAAEMVEKASERTGIDFMSLELG